MRRFVSILSIVSAILVLICIAAIVVSFATHVQFGTASLDSDQYGIGQHYRQGVFLANGRLVWASGTIRDWGYDQPRLGPSSGEERGVFFGDFSLWDSAQAGFRLGYGYYKESDPDDVVVFPVVSSAGDRRIVSTPLVAWIVLFLALPLWRSISRRRDWPPGLTATAAIGTWLAVIGHGAMAIVAPPLGAIVLIYLLVVALWMIGRTLTRIWWVERARIRAGLCRRCGYDLRATPDPDGPLLERCPECGTYTAPLRS